MNVKQLLDKGRGNTPISGCVQRSLGPEKKKKFSGWGHQGRRPFRKAATDATGEAVIGQTPSDAVCPPRRKTGLRSARTTAAERSDVTASFPFGFADTGTA